MTLLLAYANMLDNIFVVKKSEISLSENKLVCICDDPFNRFLQNTTQYR